MKEELKLSAPWEIFYSEFILLFKDDPDISSITFDDAPGPIKTIKMYVEDQDKADALSRIIPNRKEMGNITIHIEIVPANLNNASKVDIFKKAFDKNPIIKELKHIEGIGYSADYAVCEAKIVQYFNDDLSDVDQKRTCLAEDLVKDIIGEIPGIFVCTEKIDEIFKAPLGEWP